MRNACAKQDEVFEHSSVGFWQGVGLELKWIVVSGVGVGLVLARVELELDCLNLAMVGSYK